MEIKPPIQKRTGPRFQIGDMVEITASKHKDPETKGVYDMYNGRVGEVVAVNGMDADVRMESGSREVITFPKAQSPRGVGIYKYTAPFELEGSAAIEMVYLAGGEVTDEQKVVVEAYKARGRNHEKRPGYYYSGHAFTARLNAAGQVYFGMNPQQRLRVDVAEGGFMARSFNPSKGDVIYIGLVGRRPTSWKSELDAIRTESMAAAK
jgi:ribosomal protein L21E